MKILLVRGKNLASLAGEWVVDFTASPLAKAGTFAITGPTGAGKSTLLDAICLGLYGQTPRYSGAVKHKVGQEQDDDDEHLSSGDARGILRRGSGEGHAEVEFIAKDGLRYRAKWSVQRAHKRANGRFQNAVRTVADVATGQVIESGIDRVSGWVVDHVGLTLEQFTRSVMLPQGEFAAFLRADAKERAGLLEKLTATVRYGVVGRLAFEHARDAANALREEEKKRGEHAVLDAGARAELEASREAARAASTEAATRAGGLERDASWFAQQRSLAALVASAAETLAGARAVHEGAAARRAALADIVAAEPLRAAIERATDAARNLAGATSRRDESARQAASAASLASTREEARVADERALAEATGAMEDARVGLVEARRLDTVVSSHDATARASEALVSRRRAEREAGLAALGAARRDVEANARVQEAAEQWLRAHPASATLAAGWSLARASLDRFRQHESERARLARAAPPLAANLGEAAAALEGLEARSAAAAAELVAMTAQLAAAETESALHPQANAQSARRALEVARLAHEQADNLLAQATRAEAEAVTATAERARHEAEALEHDAAARRAESGAEAHAAALAEVDRLHAQARAKVDVAVHRADLRPGDDCPLCGSTEHPYAARAPVVDELLGTLVARQRELRAAETRARGEASTAVANASASRRAALAARGREAAAVEELARHAAAWAALARAENLLPLEGARVALQAEAARLQAQGNEVSALEVQANRAAEAERRARDAWKNAHEAAQAAAAAVEKATKAVASAQRAADDNARELRNAEAGIDAALHDLAAPLAGRGAWRGALHADAVGFGRACAEEVEGHARAEASRNACVRDAAALAARVAACELSVAQAGARLQEAEAERALALSMLGSAREQRALLLGGRAAADVERELQAAVKSRQSRLDASQGAASAARAAAAAAQARLEEAARAREQAEAEATRRAEARDAALDDAEIPLAEAERRLAVPPAWTAAERAALDALERAARDAASTHAGREGDLRAHEATPRPEASADDVATKLEAARQARDEANTRVGVLDQQLREDDARVARVAEIDARIEALAALHQRRAVLADLLGDSSGNRFRTFVQSITLEVLVARANEQLVRIAPRYRLDRAPGDSLALQVVDRDSADAIRPVSSLSGGETFLASLALALGLSSLAARDLRIGSLFIDEGFGTLDAQTLDTVVELLESLQATGRQVGIITHVSGLADSLGAWVRVVKATSTHSRIEVGSGPLPA